MEGRKDGGPDASSSGETGTKKIETIKLEDWLRAEPFTLALSSGFFGFYAHCGALQARDSFFPHALMTVRTPSCPNPHIGTVPFHDPSIDVAFCCCKCCCK